VRTPRVLFIDDEIPLIKNLSSILQLMGYQADIATDGEQGLKALQLNEYDVVVLDLRMPRLSGIDVLKKIDPTRVTAPEVIIMTGFASVESGIEGLSHGAFDYMTKPVKIKDLVERITAAWERKKRKESGSASLPE
jgi:two-component system, OmpR family, response regulator